MKFNLRILFALVLGLGFKLPTLDAKDLTMVNNTIKEIGQQSEVVTYGSFKAGTYRDAYDVPVNFGTLVSISPNASGGAVFWFQDDQGTLRNVQIDDIVKPIIIHRAGTVTLAP